jgi:queuosine precursor transporter
MASSTDIRPHYADTSKSLYPYVIVAFVACLLISNIATTKLISFGPIITDGGFFLYPLTYLIDDVLSEVYGFKAARRAILVGFAVMMVACLNFYLVEISPAAPGWNNQGAYSAILGFVPRIVLASMCGYLAGEFLNTFVIVKLKARNREQKLWLRLVTSTIVAELIDTLVFCTVAFYGVITGPEFANYVFFGYVYKTLLEIVLLPVTYPVIGWIKRREPSYHLETAR